MKNFVCWDEGMAHRVMNTEAIQRPDHIFLAVHQPLTLYREGRTEDYGQIDYGKEGVKYSEREFLDEFLRTPDFVFVPILGEPGTGKSHLVRWLAANIRPSESQQVLLIRKVGTNLRDIISEILKRVEGAQFEEYRKRLSQSVNEQVEGQARELLLSHLATLAGPSNPRNQTDLGEFEELRDLLVDGLPSFLYDPFIRQILLQDNGVIHRLTVHTIGQRDTIEHVDERRQFTVQDLPFDVRHIGQASKLAQRFYRQVAGDPGLKEAVVRWLNSHLDGAMVQVLNLGRDDLKRLMREVREELGERGAELILLIEDFTIAQGIDRQLLDSILAPPDEIGDRRLCVMRTAIACTPGYFKLMADTVRQRTTFRVVLDFDRVSDDSSVTPHDLELFVSKYLNAARWDEETIRRWAAGIPHTASGAEEVRLKSRCEGCKFKEECHDGFGEVEGVGFYPFTPRALQRMSARVNDGKFNPRLIIKDLLKYTLVNCRASLSEGNFPPPSLLEQFQGGTLPGNVKDKIRELDRTNSARRQVLLDLWSVGREVEDLHEVIHEAFDLPPLGISAKSRDKGSTSIHMGGTPSGRAEPGTAGNGMGATEHGPVAVQTGVVAHSEAAAQQRVVGTAGDVRAPAGDANLPEDIKNDIDALDRWAQPNGQRMPQELAEKLRRLLFEALKERVQWETEILLEDDFIGNPTGQAILLPGGISFKNAFQNVASGIKLEVPLKTTEEDMSRTQLALQGLILQNHHKNWKFPDGDRYFRRYASQLEVWSAHLLEQVRKWPRKSGDVWDPVPDAVKLLAIGARLGGLPSDPEADMSSSVNSLFAPDASFNADGRAATWRTLFEEWGKDRPGLLEVVRSRVSCVKGASREVQVIDTSQLVGPLEEVRKAWGPSENLPDDLRSNYVFIRKLSSRFAKDLKKAVKEDREAKLGWYRNAAQALGEEFDKREGIAALRKAVTAAVNEGKFPNTVRRDELNKAIDTFESAPVDSLFRELGRIAEVEDPAEAFPLLSSLDMSAFRAADDFLRLSESFMRAALVKARAEVDNREGGVGAGRDAYVQSISKDIATLRGLLKEVMEG